MSRIVKINPSQQVAPAPDTLQRSGAIVSQGGTNTAPGTASLLTELADLTPLLNGSHTLSTITYSLGVVTATATSAHGFPIGDPILLTIAGCTPTGYNGTWLCTPTTTTAVTYSVPGTLAASTVVGVYTEEDVAEVLAAATTFFAQGTGVGITVLEFGPDDVAHGVASLTAYLTANPNTDYMPGSEGFYYSYLVPKTWDGNSSFLTLISTLEGLSAQTYFYVTTTLATYGVYTNLMKNVKAYIEAPAYGQWAANALTAITYASGIVTATTTTAHGVSPGQWFKIAGVTPTGYNGTWLALPGTTGSTLVYAVPSSLATESVLGTLVASYYASGGITSVEFDAAADLYVNLNYNPSAINKVPPNAFAEVTAVTPFPTRGNSALLNTLEAASINIIGTGAEGGISNTLMNFGTTMDGHDFTYWYSVDWVQQNLDISLANAIINGSNNPVNPLYYDQNGIDRLTAVIKQVMSNAIAFGLAVEVESIVAVPFVTYVKQNEANYAAGIYTGFAVTYTPQRGFRQITVNLVVSAFPAG